MPPFASVNHTPDIVTLENPSILTASGTTNVDLVNNTATPLPWSIVTTTGAASASDLPTNTSVWTCSDPGVYYVVLNYYLLNSVGDFALTANAFIQKSTDGGSNWTQVCGGRFQLGNDDDGFGANNTIARYISMNLGDKIRCSATGKATSGAGVMRVVYNDERTFFQIAKQR
jgi:hypothetical protein